MSFQPVVPLSGYAGWMFLNRTLEAQQTAFSESASQKRDAEYFSEKIGSVQTADDLVNDRQLLKVALGAFGLDDDIDNRYFIKKVLEEGTSDSEALANKLSDKRYLELSEAFGFGESDLPNTGLSGFADKIVASYESHEFEIAVGEQDEDLRLALNVQRELEALVAKGVSDDTAWYSIMGSEPLREVFDTAFGLPDEFAQLDLGVQLETYKEKAERLFGSSEVSQFSGAEELDKLVSTFLLRSELEDMQQSMSPGNIALTLLGG